jgi:hypothetical protein
MSGKAELPVEIVKAFENMLERGHTKLVGPAIAYTVVRLYQETKNDTFTALEIRRRYQKAVCEIVDIAGTNLHLGAWFDNAYISREDRGVGKHGILRPIGGKRYTLSEPYRIHAADLAKWIPERIKKFLNSKLGKVIKLGEPEERLRLSQQLDSFVDFLRDLMKAQDGGTSFEIASFAILKVYLEQLACRIYRDTVTSSHEGGTDLSTDFGAVYQIKKLKITHKHEADKLFSEVKTNFDNDRIHDGRVVIIIDDISPECKSYLLKKNSLKYIQREDLLQIASIIKDLEDRQKVLRVIHDEFLREYSNEICSRHGCDGHNCPILNRQ